jgi:hypothetical protein
VGPRAVLNAVVKEDRNIDREEEGWIGRRKEGRKKERDYYKL